MTKESIFINKYGFFFDLWETTEKQYRNGGQTMKKKIMKRVIAVLTGATLILSATGCGGSKSSDSGSDSDTVKVGILHSLTGSMAISEKSVRDAEVMAIEEINASGGVLGKKIKYVEEMVHQNRQHLRQRQKSLLTVKALRQYLAAGLHLQEKQ